MPKRKKSIGIDLFCGVGGMSLGFEQAGFDVVAAFDFEKRHVESYKKNFSNTSVCVADLTGSRWCDLKKLAALRTNKIDVVFGGPPCQGFSICGRRDVDDERNLLLFEFVRLVREIQPRYFVLENVDGLLMSHADSIRTSLERRIRYAGYRLVRPVSILDAADYGVPQRRKRAFYIGYREGQIAPHYPKPVSRFNSKTNVYAPNVQDAIGDLPNIEAHDYLFDSDIYKGRLRNPSHYAKLLRGDIRESSK